jgi:hypothetical protein
LNKFRELDIKNEFTYYEFDGIPCYALNFGNDRKKTNKIVLEILEKVYGFASSEIFQFEVFDQGKL